MSKKVEADSAPYFKGLNYLLSEQADAAVKTVVEEIPVNSDTLSTHLAIGKLMRSKGEVESAISIHQNLLSRPLLPQESLHNACLELARDYISAGLLDRAERLLKDVVAESEQYRSIALVQLLRIYEQEKDWNQAIAVAIQLLPKKTWLGKSSATADDSLPLRLSHFYCEKAIEYLASGDLDNAQNATDKAENSCRDNIRAQLLSADVALRQGQAGRALERSRLILRSRHEYSHEALPRLKAALAALGREEDYLGELKALSGQNNSSALAVEIADVIAAQGSKEEAAEYLLQALQQRQTLTMVSRMLALGPQNLQASLPFLIELVKELKASHLAHRCQQCGFSARKLHWQCPTCEQWGTIAPIRGTQGD
ncbi:MAG: lipopolysaccharide assembly protein LapB [Spongiibacteraceae bacterium]